MLPGAGLGVSSWVDATDGSRRGVLGALLGALRSPKAAEAEVAAGTRSVTGKGEWRAVTDCLLPPSWLCKTSSAAGSAASGRSCEDMPRTFCAKAVGPCEAILDTLNVMGCRRP